MDVESWTHLLHEVGTITAAVAAVIAAASSLKNGKRLKNGTKGDHPGSAKKRVSRPKDWYHTPDL